MMKDKSFLLDCEHYNAMVAERLIYFTDHKYSQQYARINLLS